MDNKHYLKAFDFCEIKLENPFIIFKTWDFPKNSLVLPGENGENGENGFSFGSSRYDSLRPKGIQQGNNMLYVKLLIARKFAYRFFGFS